MPSGVTRKAPRAEAARRGGNCPSRVRRVNSAGTLTIIRSSCRFGMRGQGAVELGFHVAVDALAVVEDEGSALATLAFPVGVIPGRFVDVDLAPADVVRREIVACLAAVRAGAGGVHHDVRLVPGL